MAPEIHAGAQRAELAALDRDSLKGALYKMYLIRKFEERTYQEYTRPGQKIGGFCHLYSGQEAVAVGTASIFDKSRDYLFAATKWPVAKIDLSD